MLLLRCVLLDKVYHRRQALGKLIKILLVEENLMAVKSCRAISLVYLAGLGNGEEVIPTTSRLDIKEVCSATGLDLFREDLVAVIIPFNPICK